MGIKADKHADFEGFVEKFKPKKTTDDCYTPVVSVNLFLTAISEHLTAKGTI